MSLLLLAGIAAGAASDLAPIPARTVPNILLLFPDSWRYDWDGLHGSLNTGALPLKMPVTKRLASRGVRFTQAYVPAPVCAPSRSCLASGRHYDHTQVPSNGQDYPAVSEVPTFYSLLRAHGYHTMTTGKDDLTKASQLGSKTGYPGCPECTDGDGMYRTSELGFSDALRYSGKRDVVNMLDPHEMYGFFLRNQSVKTETGKETDAWQAHRACFGEQDVNASLCDRLSYPSEFYEDDYTAASAVELLRRRPREKPFFLHVSFPGPHGPFLVTADMHDSTSDGRVWPEATDNPKNDTGGVCEATGEPDTTSNRCNYAAEVENLDRLFQIVIDEVDKQGELENTLIVVTSDHGEMLGDHGEGGKSKPWQGSAAVPLVIAGPGVQAGQVVTRPVGNLDIVGTFLDFAGVDKAPGMETTSLRSILDPSSGAPAYRKHVSSGLNNFRMVVMEIGKVSYKYICCQGKCPGSPSTAPTVSKSGWMQMLIDVTHDEFDMADLSAEKPDIVQQLRALLPQEGYSGNFSAGCESIDSEEPRREHERLMSEQRTVRVQVLGSIEESLQVTLKGLEVADVQPDGPAHAAGIMLGWRLLAINGSALAGGSALHGLRDGLHLGSRLEARFGLVELIV